MAEPTREEIAGAVARGWCHPDNEQKVMDEKLAWAIVAEIELLLAPEPALDDDYFANPEVREQSAGPC